MGFGTSGDTSIPLVDLRDQFAMAALQGICARGGLQPKRLAALVYQIADAMLEEREVSRD